MNGKTPPIILATPSDIPLRFKVFDLIDHPDLGKVLTNIDRE
ncbi:hypothetical protein [Leptolyngbya sp. 'hensonii']|nr:hypothetical protein [Leptolyngbya sp. 'hensonii']